MAKVYCVGTETVLEGQKWQQYSNAKTGYNPKIRKLIKINAMDLTRALKKRLLENVNEQLDINCS